MVAQAMMLRASSSETYMSAARKVSAWKLLSVTPNCLRLVRYVVVASSAESIAPRASWPRRPSARRWTSLDRRRSASPPSPSGSAGVHSKARRAARPPSKVGYAVRADVRGLGHQEQPVPSAKALTTNTSARPPLGTGSLTPVRVVAARR